MSTLHYPPPCSDARLTFECVRLFPARPNGCREAKHRQRGPHLLVVIPLIQTQALRLLCGRLWPLDDEAVEGGRDQFHIRPIGAGHHHAHRQTMSLGQEAALDAGFAAIRGVGARFFPHLRVPWSSLRPCLTTARLSPLTRQTVLPPLARVSER